MTVIRKKPEVFTEDIRHFMKHAVLQISFGSQEAMAGALATDAYKKAHGLRERYMRETSVGIHSARVDDTVTFV
ncbi:hypothetical protein [Streptomyces sp. NPDC010273]|uniref:hypothetical protein n=1 Tax=Streptomyces sp. NPDC010273 TaxID=3364829 RepID=UPI0036E16AC8